MRMSLPLLFLVLWNSTALAQGPQAPLSSSDRSPVGPVSSVLSQQARLMSAEAAYSIAPGYQTAVQGRSLGWHVGWGAAIGAAAGVASSIFVISQCDAICDEDRPANIALHVGVGTATGAALGAILYHLRR